MAIAMTEGLSLRGAAFSREELATWRDVAILAMTEAKQSIAVHHHRLDRFVPRDDAGAVIARPERPWQSIALEEKGRKA